MSHHAEHKTYSFVLVGMSHSGLMYNVVFDVFFPSVTMSYEVFSQRQVKYSAVKATSGKLSIHLQR